MTMPKRFGQTVTFGDETWMAIGSSTSDFKFDDCPFWNGRVSGGLRFESDDVVVMCVGSTVDSYHMIGFIDGYFKESWDGWQEQKKAKEED